MNTFNVVVGRHKIGASFVARSKNNLRATTQSMRQRAKMVVQQQTASTGKRPDSKAVGLPAALIAGGGRRWIISCRESRGSCCHAPAPARL
jgi:hypothetical protein